MAKTLIASFPNAKPHDAEGYITALASILAQYPAALARECADPRTGIARTFTGWAPNVADVVAWCDTRLALYEALARTPPRARTAALPAPPAPQSPDMAERILGFLASLGDRLRHAGDPLRDMHRARGEHLAERRREIVRREPPRVPTNEELLQLYPPRLSGEHS